MYSCSRRCFFELDDSNLTDAVIQAIWGDAENIDISLVQRILAIDTAEFRTRSLAYMESRIAACGLADDQVQALPWIVAYGQRLALDENDAKARELIEGLEGLGLDLPPLRSTLAMVFSKSAAASVRRLADELCAM